MKKESLLRTLLKKQTIVQKLFTYTDDYEIFTTLIGHEVELGETIESPIRAVDDHPSFALYIPTRVKTDREDEIWFKDLADGRFGDVLRFTRFYAMHHYGLVLKTNLDVVKFLDEHLELGIFDKNTIRKSLVKRDYTTHKIKKKIFYKSRRFTSKDKKYWDGLDVDTPDLNYFNVKSVGYLLQDDGNIRKEFRKGELVFIYKLYDEVKLYQPNAPKAFKFRNTCPGNDFRYYQGFEQLQGYDTLVITKSMKDVIVFWKYFNTYMSLEVDVLAPHAESIIPPDDFIEAIKKTYKRIIVVSDFDLAGVKFARQCKKKGLEIKFVSTKRVLINGKYKVLDKDISDYRVNHNKVDTIKLLNTWKIS